MATLEERNGTFWRRLTPAARVGLIVGVALIAASAIALALWSTRSEYAVLFSQLNESDAASIVTQLKQQKVSYRLVDGGATIEVPAHEVYNTRLSLFSSGIPLSGGIGFELYDHQGYGLTEEDQRVEYQRALQGELARTIDSLQGVKYARVHLVIPQQTIFRGDRERPTAAVSLVLKAGASLSDGEVAGIQRLVAASVAGLKPAEVVINDQRGVTLSAVDPSQSGAQGSDSRLAMERQVESYLAHKIAVLLDRAYGPRQAWVSVDVSLNFDQVRTTVQSLLPLSGAAGDSSGALLRRQEVRAGEGAPQSVATGSRDSGSTRAASSTTDVEYEYGRRVEDIVAAPGTIERMSIGVVVPGALSEARREKITELVRVAAGANVRRGDEIDVESLTTLESGAVPAAAVPPAAQPALVPLSHSVAAVVPQKIGAVRGWSRVALIAAACIVAGGLLGLALGQSRRTRPAPLSPLERQRLLEQMERALTSEVSVAARSGA